MTLYSGFKTQNTETETLPLKQRQQQTNGDFSQTEFHVNSTYERPNISNGG